MSTSPAFGAAVLCGGASARMGVDKALLRVGGAPMARRVADAAREAGADQVVAIGGDGDALAALGLQVVPDHEPGGGPLPAVVTALDALPGRPVLVLACDLVTPDPVAMAATVAALTEAIEAHVAVPVDAEGRRQWVHAAWRPSAREVLESARRSGERALHRAARDMTVVEVAGLPDAALRDADVPGDLPTEG